MAAPQDDLFEWTFPLFTLAKQPGGGRPTMPDDLHALTDEGYGRVLPLFTDQDLAERFMDVAGAGLAIVELATLVALVRTLGHAQQTGAAHVFFDPAGTPGSRQRPGHTLTTVAALQVAGRLRP